MNKRQKLTGIEVPLARSDITELERKYVLEVLNSSYLSIGPKLVEFEEKIARYVGTKYAVAVNSGTSGLHLIVRAMGIEKGDEVITTPFSFIASANCILFERAKPVFVDIDEKTLNIDVAKIKEVITQKTRAILAVDVFGHPAKWDELRGIAKNYNLKLIEDSAEALGSEYKGRKVGAFGEAGVFAFYPNKQITTAEGGVIVSDDEKIAELCLSMRNQGRGESGAWLNHKRLGYNYRMDELSAALGCAQLQRINEILEKRAKVAGMYNERLRNIKEIEIPYIAPYVSKMSWFVYVIRLRDDFTQGSRDRILKLLRENGIECRAYFSPIHLQPFYREMFGYEKGDFPLTESVSRRTIALPFYNNLSEEKIEYVVGCLKKLVKYKKWNV